MKTVIQRARENRAVRFSGKCVFSAFFFVAFCVGLVSGIFAQQRFPEKLREWNVPKIDFRKSGQLKKYDPRLVQVLETARESINDCRERFAKNPHEFQRVEEWLNALAGYVVLLREVGLNAEAESILDAFPHHVDAASYVRMDLRERVMNMHHGTNAVPTQQNKLSLEQIGNCLRNGVFMSGTRFTTYQGSGEDYHQTHTAMSFVPGSQAAGGIETRQVQMFPTFREWAAELIEEQAPNFDAVAEEIEKLKENSQRYSGNSLRIMNLALILSVGGRQEEAKKAMLVAIEQCKKESADRRNSSDNDLPVDANLIRDNGSVWRNIASTYMKMGENELVFQTLEEMKETVVELFAAGHDVNNWARQWDEILMEMIPWAARETSIDEAMKLNEKLLRKRDGRLSNCWRQIAVQFARQGREGDVDKIFASDFMQDHSNRSEAYYWIVKHALETLPRDEALAKLEEFFPSGQGNLMSLSPGMQNDIGLFYLRLDDGDGARKIFTRLNDSFKIVENNMRAETENGDPHYGSLGMYAPGMHGTTVDANTPGMILAARYEAGVVDETLAFLDTLTEPKYAIPVTNIFVAKIADADNRELTKKLVLRTLELVKTIDKNPGVVGDPNVYPPKPFYRNDYLWMIAESALLAGALSEARIAMDQAMHWDAEIPDVDGDGVIRRIYHQEIQVKGPMVPRWEQCFGLLIGRNDIDAALLCLNGCAGPVQRREFSMRIARWMIANPSEVGSSRATSAGTETAGEQIGLRPRKAAPQRNRLFRPRTFFRFP